MINLFVLKINPENPNAPQTSTPSATTSQGAGTAQIPRPFLPGMTRIFIKFSNTLNICNLFQGRISKIAAPNFDQVSAIAPSAPAPRVRENFLETFLWEDVEITDS